MSSFLHSTYTPVGINETFNGCHPAAELVDLAVQPSHSFGALLFVFLAPHYLVLKFILEMLEFRVDDADAPYQDGKATDERDDYREEYREEGP